MKAAYLAVLGLLAAISGGSSWLVIDKRHSHVDVSLGTMLGSFGATLDGFRPEIAVSEGQVTAARVPFDLGSLHTGDAKRDKAIRSWLDVAHFPGGVFLLEKLDAAEAGQMRIRGALTLHAVTRKIAFPVVITTDGRLYSLDGELTLDPRDFGYDVAPRAGLLMPDPRARVRFHLQGAVSSPEGRPTGGGKTTESLVSLAR